MSKRMFGALLVLAILMAPSFALAAPDLDRADPRPAWVERVWEGLKELFGVEGPRDVRQRRVDVGPQSLTAAEDGGPHISGGG